MKVIALFAMTMLAAGAAAQAQASTTYLYLGQSAETYVLHGQGPVAPGIGSFTNQQGSESVSGGVVTDSLSGAITTSTDPRVASGSYDFVTTYAGTPIGDGGTQIQSQSETVNTNYFTYSALDPSVDMTLYLTGTPTGAHVIPLVTNGAFDGPGFSFSYVSITCTGVAVCGQNNVGLTPGATDSGPVTLTISYASPAPEPAAWALMMLGVGLVGGALRRRRGAATAPLPTPPLPMV